MCVCRSDITFASEKIFFAPSFELYSSLASQSGPSRGTPGMETQYHGLIPVPE